MIISMMLYPAVNGAYTELFAGLAPEAANLKEGEWVVPFGRVMQLRKDFVGGKTAGEFWEWSEKQVGRYA
jgi:retinol dehydrogenase-12